MSRLQKLRRMELTLTDKVNLIKEAESTKMTRQQLGEKFGIGKTTVTDIIKKKDQYLKQFEENADGSRQRVKTTTKFKDVSALVWTWFQQAQAKNIPVSGPMVQEKALAITMDSGVYDFKASNGWLDSWRSRYAVKSFKVNGESADVDAQVVDDFKSRIAEMCQGYSAGNIFNTDETGVYFRALPDRTLAHKADDCKGGKVSKERLTVMFTCSMTGEKLKPFVIGKAAKPRCFKHIDVQTLPVYWNSNKKAWMTGSLFNEYLREFNNLMRRQRRKVLLFLDNATSHCPDIKLSHVTLKFFPANTTSVLQPLDQGIIRAFKARYRKRLLRAVIAKVDNATTASEVAKSVNVLDAIRWISGAWNETKTETIVKCFRNSGFNVVGLDGRDAQPDTADDEELRRLIQQVHQSTEGEGQCTVDEFINFDDSVPTEETYGGEWEKQIVENFLSDKTQETNDDEDDSEEKDDDSENTDPMTAVICQTATS
ncbi:hypothetical protein ACEWY4_022365 [Coilia grayii]|uniref:HTH CENPB-type domain-containing protein n=1 Tax=Coilia grayii TaxID=363190 RepID=A0ABD1J5S9_9TELE